MEIKIKYKDGVEEIKQAHAGEWYDLRAAYDVFIPHGEYKKIDLGVAMELPEGYEAHVVPRSSTFEKYGIILANSFGVIDNKYCGDNDFWSFPALCIKQKTFENGRFGSKIYKNDRICQFRIMPQQPEITFKKVDHLGNDDRGGFGSSGTK